MENMSMSAPPPTVFDVQSPTWILAGTRLSLYLGIGTILAIAWLLQPKKQTSGIDAPFYKASKTKWIFDAETLIKDSYNTFQDKVYQIKATEGIQVLLPAKYVGEIKALPEDVLSATEAMADVSPPAVCVFR